MLEAMEERKDSFIAFEIPLLSCWASMKNFQFSSSENVYTGYLLSSLLEYFFIFCSCNASKSS